MKSTIRRLITPTIALTLGLIILLGSTASASFNKNRLIDDSIFNQDTAMSSGEIDSFLNGFDKSCISPDSGFQARIPSGYSPSGGFTYGSYGTAGQVIATSSDVYGINPKVLITTLEKEQSLVTGQNSSTYCSPSDDNNHKYAAATGYGCPDSGTSYNYSGLDLYRRNGVTQKNVGPTCVNTSQKAGFSQQVIRAAWLLKFGQQRSLGNVDWAVVTGSWDNSDDPPAYYGGPMTQGNLKRCQTCSTTYFDGYTTIDGAATHMDTGGTAALYWYTPHFHGNENFVGIFSGWFGSSLVDTTKDVAFVGDWDGDGKATPAIKRGNDFMFDNDNDGEADASYSWGKTTDIVIVGDWDGDGKDEIGLKRGNEYFLDNDNNASSDVYYAWGKTTDIVIVGDWDGDGKDEIGLKRGNEYFLDNDNNASSDVYYAWGKTTDIVIVGDWDGDGKDEIGLKRGNEYFLDYENNASSSVYISWGKPTDTVIVGDWDDDGKDEIGLKRGNEYFFDYDVNASSDVYYAWGDDTDKIMVGDWDGNGSDGIGLKRGSYYFLDYDINASSNVSFVYTY